MPENKTQRIGVLALQCMDTVARHTRVRAFVIAVLDQRYFGLGRTLDVVIRDHGGGESCGYPGHACRIAPSACDRIGAALVSGPGRSVFRRRAAAAWARVQTLARRRFHLDPDRAPRPRALLW